MKTNIIIPGSQADRLLTKLNASMRHLDRGGSVRNHQIRPMSPKRLA